MKLPIELFPYFQPIVGVASGQIVGYETLGRYYDEDHQLCSAGPFFSDSEIDSNLVLAWDRTIRRKAMNRFSQLPDNTILTLNISAAWLEQVENYNFLPTLQLIEEYGIKRERIIIEITDCKGDLDKLAHFTKIYRSQGLKVAIDDFGADFKQLERVIDIQPDIIKLDMRLFKTAVKGGVASDIVLLLTRLGKRNGCQIICAGVETRDEFVFGLSSGVPFMQGFLFSPAVAEFKIVNTFEQKITLYRNKFLQDALIAEQNKIKTINNIKGFIKKLQHKLQTDFNLNELSASPFEENGILRFYLCNNEGTQISSNFNFAAGKWHEDPRQIGFNWSWRPYFIQLIALEKNGDCNRLVASEHYHDFSTDQSCKTLSIRLDDMRILMVDIAADWA